MTSQMKLHDIDVAAFIKTIDSCKGDVFLETPEGDRLNLKSKLCQFAGIARLIQGGIIAEACIRCELPEDETKLFRFGLFREVPSNT